MSPHCFFLSSTTGLDIEDWSLLDWTLTDWTMTAVFCSAATSSAALPCMQQKTIRRVYLYVLKLLAVPWLRFIAYDLEHIRVSLKWQKRNGAKNGTSRVWTRNIWLSIITMKLTMSLQYCITNGCIKHGTFSASILLFSCNETLSRLNKPKRKERNVVHFHVFLSQARPYRP